MENKYYTATILDKLLKECFENNVVHRMLNMIKDNKYYTPSIEEFHVGFEFEKQWSDGSWSREKLEADELGDIDDEMLVLTRVKYLDREDIESLGFELISEQVKEYSHWCHFKIKNDIEMHVQLDKKYVPRLLNISSLSNKHFGNFKIKVKNKSEFKRILKQVGVL